MKAYAPGHADTREFTEFSDLAELIEENPAQVYVIVAHGDKQDHKIWGSADTNWEGERLGISAPEFGLALRMPKWANCVVLMGCCYSGTDDWLESLKRSGAAAVVAPIGSDTISVGEIIENYGTFLRNLARNQSGRDNSDLVPTLFRESFTDSFRSKATIWPA